MTIDLSTKFDIEFDSPTNDREVYEAAVTKAEAAKQQEMALCGVVMRKGNDIYEKAREIVQPESFRIRVLGTLWTAFENLYQAGLQIDTLTAGDELERMGKMDDFASGPWHGRVFLSNIRQEGDPRNWLSYATNVQDYAGKRQALEIANQVAKWAQNGRRLKDIVSDFTAEMSKIAVYGAADENTKSAGEILGSVWDWVEATSKGEIRGVKTGFDDLDNILGSLIPKNLYIAAGRPGQGKTGLLLSIARHAAKVQKKNVAIFSLEMGNTSVMQRLVSQEAEVDLSHLIDGTKMTDDDWARLANTMGVIESWPLIINDLPAIRPSQIRQTCRKIKAHGGLDLVIVDYIQLAWPDDDKKKQRTREQEVSAVSQGLLYLARELDVPVLAAAQLSRAVEQRANKRPVLSDLRESGSLEQDAYSVMFIHRPDLNEEDGAQKNVAQVIVEKHRNGPVGVAEMFFNGPYTRFESGKQKIFNPNAAE